MSNYREQVGNLPSQFRSTRNVISWKQEEIRIPGNALVTVHFDDTKPNMFMLQNPNETVLHIGITKIPTEHNYEFKIEANNSSTFGRPVVTDVLYILNKGNVNATVSLFSVADDFDMSILQSLSVDLSKSPIYDGIIKGFTAGVSLPSGTNTIGKVLLSDDDRAALGGSKIYGQTFIDGAYETTTIKGPDNEYSENDLIIETLANDDEAHNLWIKKNGNTIFTVFSGESINDLRIRNILPTDSITFEYSEYYRLIYSFEGR